MLILLLFLLSCSELVFDAKNKMMSNKVLEMLIKEEREKKQLKKTKEDLIKIIKGNREEEEETFVTLLKSIKEQKNFEQIMYCVLNELFESEKPFYLEEFLKRVEELNIQQIYDIIKKIFSNRYRERDLIEIAVNNKLDHMKLLLDFYDKKIEGGYKPLLLRLLENYTLCAEPNRDISIEVCTRVYLSYKCDNYKKTKNDFKDTYIEWDEKKQKTRFDNLTNILTIFKDEDIWNKEDIGKIIDIAIKNHKWHAVKIILYFAKEKGLNIKAISNIPFIKLLEYYYYNGEFKRENGEISTSKREEVEEMFRFLLKEGANLLGEDEQGYTIFWKMITCLKRIKEIKYILSMIYKYRGEKELCSVINGISENGQSVYYRLTKMENKQQYCKLVEGNPQIWKIDIGSVIRENWKKNKDKLTKIVKGKKLVIEEVIV